MLAGNSTGKEQAVVAVAAASPSLSEPGWVVAAVGSSHSAVKGAQAAAPIVVWDCSAAVALVACWDAPEGGQDAVAPTER